MELTAGQAFLEQYRASRIALAPHPDADGLAGAALLYRWLTGERVVCCPAKGESIHTAQFADQLRQARPEALLVIDQGARVGALLPGVPTLTIDHHVPSGIPEGVFVTAYPDAPQLSAAEVCYRLIGEPDDWLWLAAVGHLGDYGVKEPSALLQRAKTRYTATALQETVALINAGRRSSRFDWQPALALLLTAEHPRQIARGLLPETAQLQEDRAEVNRELQRARRSRPFIAASWAVIPFASPCLVHALTAVSWVGRLKDLYVLAANFGYRPGYVHFSVRAAQPVDLPTALRDLAPEGLPGEFAHGHAAATGGVVPRESFLLLLERMGFVAEQVMDIEHIATK